QKIIIVRRSKRTTSAHTSNRVSTKGRSAMRPREEVTPPKHETTGVFLITMQQFVITFSPKPTQVKAVRGELVSKDQVQRLLTKWILLFLPLTRPRQWFIFFFTTHTGFRRC